MAIYSVHSHDYAATACTRRLILSPDMNVIRQAEEDLGMTRQQYADHVFQSDIIEGFPFFANGIDGDTPQGRLAAVRWLTGYIMALEEYGQGAFHSRSGVNALEWGDAKRWATSS